MPEGDTIFRTARTLNRALGGKAVTGFRTTFSLLTRFDDDTPLAGRVVDRVESRGKWVLIYFSGGGDPRHAHADERQLAHLSSR